MSKCPCYACTSVREDWDGENWARQWMVLCPTCGNKRCPHASDHRNACTDSNEPGQPGSLYAEQRPPSEWDTCTVRGVVKGRPLIDPSDRREDT